MTDIHGAIQNNDIVDAFVSAAKNLRLRCVVSRGFSQLSASQKNRNVLEVENVNHSKLFKHVSMVVHHGGAGTTTAAAIAGKPQIIIPQGYDQPYWANKINMKKVGRAFTMCKIPDVYDFLTAIKHCMQADIVANARELSRQMALDGAKVAAQRLLQCLKER